MTFTCECPACGGTNHVDWSRIGREMFCGSCGKSFCVPAPMERIAKTTTPKEATKFRCPGCGKKYASSGKLAGQKIRCKKCGAGVRVPGGETPSASPSSAMKRARAKDHETIPTTDRPSSTSRPELPTRRDDRELDVDHPAPKRNKPVEIPAEKEESDEHESVDDLMPILDDPRVLDVRQKRLKEAVLASRSEAMERVSREAAEEEARKAAAKKIQARKRAKSLKKKKSSNFDTKETLSLIAWVSAFVAVLAFLAWGYPNFRFPLGGLLCFTGFVVYLLGWAALKQLASEEGDIRGILFRIFPPYQWWFIWSRWSDAKDYAIFFAAGLLIMAIGGAVIKTSPTGKKAEASEREYQKMLKRNADSSPFLPDNQGIVIDGLE